MIKYDPKHYQKDFQTKANAWWRTLSINEMKAFERQYKVAGSMALPSDIAAIYSLQKIET